MDGMTPEEREQEKTIREQIMELKRMQREEQEESRRALQEQMREIMQRQKESEHLRSRELNQQIREILLSSQEGDTERKKSLREQFAEKVMRAQDEHVRKCHPEEYNKRLEVLQEYGDVESRKGFLKLHIIGALADGPSHGYELIHKIGRHTGDMWRPSPGSMYPALEALEANGIIACQGDGRRKIYSLTPKGEEAMAQIQKKRQELFLEMKSYLSDILGE